MMNQEQLSEEVKMCQGFGEQRNMNSLDLELIVYNTQCIQPVVDQVDVKEYNPWVRLES